MRLLFVAGEPDGREERAALAWIAGESALSVTPVRPESLDAAALEAVDAVWIHAAEHTPSLAGSPLEALRRFVEHGGGVLLSLFATRLVTPLGLEALPPNECRVAEWHDDADPLWLDGFRDWPGFPHIRGMQAWGAHPLFDGFVRGTYTWQATEGERIGEATYVRPRWPVAGRVVAVERAYVHLNADKAVAWEYLAGRGRVICLGAHIHFAAPSALLAPQRDRLVRNALGIFGRRTPAVQSWWPRPTVEAPPLDASQLTAAALGAALPEQASALTLSSVATSDDPFTLAGRRALVVGRERSGIDEIWIHPLCVLSGGIEMRIDGEEPEVRVVEISPEQVVRHLQTRTRFIEERIFVPLEEPALVLEYRYRRVGRARTDATPPRLELRMRFPLRLQWPMPAGALRPLRLATSATRGAATLGIVGIDERHAAVLNAEGLAAIVTAEDPSAPGARITASLAEPLRLALAATLDGMPRLTRTLRALGRHGVRGLAQRRAEHADALQHERLAIRSPLSALDTAVEWAKVRLDSFVAAAPGVGTGMMAGYAATRPGWGVSRPGYAWFFGRDACWSAHALLAAGMFDQARATMHFLAATQDITGKIAHEVTTSGAAHYDAADATPLFLRLVAAWVAWTGDLDATRAIWPSVVRALEFVASTDRDGDGLPENTGVGHGWIESGPLGGGAVTSYVAAIWISALEALRPVAHLIGDAAVARRCARLLDAAREGFDRALRGAGEERHALQRLADGSLVGDLTPLAAVPVALGAASAPAADAWLATLASDRYSAPWGVRMLPHDDARYDPKSYHGGAVWPLYTGWVSLAEYRAHEAEAGYRHLLANAMLCYERDKGAFDEVLRGDDRAAAGVCPDQAWSAAMVISPLVEGMLGAVPDALRRRLRLTPHWPREWTRAVVRRLRVGDTMLEIDATEGCLVHGVPHDGVRYRLSAEPRASLTVVLEHPVSGRRCDRVLVDGMEVQGERCGTAACPHVRVTVWLAGPVEVQFVGQPIAER